LRPQQVTLECRAVKITAISIYSVPLPVAGKPYRMARAEVTALDSTVVEVRTSTGIVGYGETCPVGPVYAPQHALGARAAFEEMGSALIGLNPLEIDNVHRAMDQSLNGARYAKAAIDIALWDIAGKAYGARVCDLLGGAVRDKVPSYYSITVGIPEESARIMKERQDEGYPRIQVKVGGRPLEEDLDTIRAVAAVKRPEVKLAVDANRDWSARDAITASRLNETLNCVFEQPCDSYEEVAAIRRVINHPIYLDESTENIGVVLRAVGEGVADGFGFKVTRLGGLTTMRTIRDICRARNLPHTVDDSWGGDIIAAACVHLGATVNPEHFDGCWIAAPYIKGHYDERNPVTINNGWIDVPKGKGLGIEPDTSK
jgi:L-alanine-DL-glutamate epimerase-like enolase superfamily enzyme